MVWTLKKLIDQGYGLNGNCAVPGCGRGRALKMDVLVEWLGEDFECVPGDRIDQSFKCGVEGHRGSITHVVPINVGGFNRGGEIVERAATPNAYAKAKGE